MKNVFALDLGNSRFKLAWYLIQSEQSIDEIQPLMVIYLDYSESKLNLKEIQKLVDFYLPIIKDYETQTYETIATGSCVAGDEKRQFAEFVMKMYFQIDSIRWVNTQTYQHLVLNQYENPDQLGIDRWISLIGCRLRYPNKSVIVVNAGTAVTIDMLSQNSTFLGGVIIPGIQLMRNALFNQTADIKRKYEEQYATFEYFPRNTANAVFSGILFSLSGAIEKLRYQLFEYDRTINLKLVNPQDIQCVLSGGDGEFFKPLIAGDGEFNPYLIINTLAFIAK